MCHLLAVFLMLLCGGAAAQPGPPPRPSVPPRPVAPTSPTPEGEGQAELRITIEPGPPQPGAPAMQAVVHYQDRVACTRALPAGANLALPLSDGVDVTGDGVPDAVIELYTGGAHCCYNYLILGGDNPCIPAATLNAANSGVEIQNIDDDPAAEFLAADWTLEYWNADYADSLSFYAILEFKDGALVPDQQAMQLPAPEPEDKEKLEAIFAETWNEPDPPGWHCEPRVPRAWYERAGKLVYGGNGEVALALMRATFQGTEAEAKAACEGFFAQLSKSPWWPGIAAMNGWEGETPETICAER
ncbi:MAG: hypothetical protein GC168_07620 [Candidatus Hydrogenedens sp.]|nr:hypothetical protein [Candidatus Hydrogenedens sp.]